MGWEKRKDNVNLFTLNYVTAQSQEGWENYTTAC